MRAVDLQSARHPSVPLKGADVTKRFAIGVTLMLSLVARPLQSAEQSSLDSLARDVERAEAIRAVKVLQRTYAQYAQFGLWNEMANLFADEGRAIIGDDAAKGRTGIATFFTMRFGEGHQGLSPGAIHTQLIE